VEGVMASMNLLGDGYAKLDAAKKHRRDFLLEPMDALHARVVETLARRLVPEIKRAFQADIAHLDRILIARYDDTGGYFRRHRDDAAAHVSYRQFAVSLNLNTHEYEGGNIMFPEFCDDRFSPSAGAAAVFSASLLHEAAPVTRGRRYVLLTFMHSAEAEARRLEQLKAA
jgi:predicted 2-oxoglutarate/Fe(II)-dependent dioxygenase YbiX